MPRLLWCEISNAPQTDRQKLLSDFLQRQNVENDVEFLSCEADALLATLDEAKQKFEIIRIGDEYVEKVMLEQTDLSGQVQALKAADTFQKSNGRWWPRNYLTEGLQRVITHDVKAIDLAGGVFIIGANGITRSVVATFVKMGFKEFNITDQNEKLAKQYADEFAKTYFSVRFHVTPAALVTQLPGVHSIAVNTMPFGADQSMVTDLSYFNFLRQSGVWIEVPLIPLDSALVAEAQVVGATVEPGINTVSHTDAAWVMGCFGLTLPMQEYRQSLRERVLNSPTLKQ